MAAVIELTSASSNMEGYFNGWTSGFSSTYGAFWDDDTNALVTNPVSTTTYEQWGNGSAGGKGVYFEGEVNYAQGNLTGTVDAIYLGTGFSQSGASGFGLTPEMTITPDSSMPSSTTDAFDWAIYDLTVNGSLDSFYDYLAVVGTEIHDTSASDMLVGFGGADTFVFTDGTDTVGAGPTGTYGFQDGVDLLDISAWGATSLSDLYMYTSGGNAVVGTTLDYSVSITLEGVSTSALGASDFIFA